MIQPPPIPTPVESAPADTAGKPGRRLKQLSVVSLISNVLGLVILGPIMGWVSGRLADAFARLDQPLPATTAWFINTSWTKVTIASIVLAVLLIVMERKVKRAGITLTVHMLVTVAVGVLIGTFFYAMMLPMITMVNRM